MSTEERADMENAVSRESVTSDRIQYWLEEKRWPKADFEFTSDMALPHPKRPRASTSQDSQSNYNAATPSDQKPRAWKSLQYLDPDYSTLLQLKKSFMKDSDLGLLETEKDFCKMLLHTKQEPPQETVFDDPIFRKICESLRGQNEARIIRDIALLITPSAEILAIQGNKNLVGVAEITNAGWNQCNRFQGTRPQPDYSIGFRFSNFSDEDRKKLNIQFDVRSDFKATEEIYFPFFTSEIKCGNQALEVANRQNAHSMTVAVRGVIQLFRKLGRAQEFHRKVLAFSVSHNNRCVELFAHYAEIKDSDSETNIEYYQHLIKSFHIASEDGKERWTAYQFTRNVYDSFVPTHLKRIKSAIEQLPLPIIAT